MADHDSTKPKKPQVLPPGYESWRGAKKRCFLETRGEFKHYGARGIVMCDDWRHSFAAFIADMGPPPSKRHGIDRKDVNGHYSCGHCEQCKRNGWMANCCWSTTKTQSRNKRTSRLVTWRGETKCVGEWAEATGINYFTLIKRFRLGWTPEQAFTIPAKLGQRVTS